MGGHDESYTDVADLQIVRKDATQIARGTVLAGRYEIEAMLGRGGAGVVLRAFDRELREAVAIKVLHPDLGQETRWIERLAREVKLARQLRHPNVCRVFDFEKADGHVFIVMELAAGGSLRRELEDRGHPPRLPEGRLTDARALAEGLAAIHAAGIAHRDVTPQNVLRMDDGRLVISDFGLATDISQSTASVHGGTIAYMAPEVVRGQRADFASDLWSLGVVIHEIVFGARPTWSKAAGGSLVPPVTGRTLARSERLAYDVCRACLSDRPGDRPASAAVVAAWLGGRVPPRGKRAGLAIVAGALAALALGAGVWWRAAGHVHPVASPDGVRILEPTGEAADWTDTSKVLATIDDRLQCLVVLPDRRTARYVWGHPAQAEDLDLVTGKRTPSPLVADTYKEGCPTVSPDGKRIAYQGYAPDGRAFAFVSEQRDGAGGVPVVPIADPSMSSEPKWLPDSRAFTIDVDTQHGGVFSLDTKRLTVLPTPSSRPAVSTMRYVVGSLVILGATVEDPFATEFAAFEWPLLTEAYRFRLPAMAPMDLTSSDGRTLLLTANALKTKLPLLRIDPVAGTIRNFGFVRHQNVRYAAFSDHGLVINTMAVFGTLWVQRPDGELRRIETDGDYFSAVSCGADIIATRGTEQGVELVRLDRSDGHVLGTLRRAELLSAPACSPDGRTWYVSQWTDPVGLYRCDAGGCERLLNVGMTSVNVSPDGSRIVFLLGGRSGITVEWLPTAGGTPHGVAISETGCEPGWSSDRLLWISKRRSGRPVWIELDADTLAETGRTVAGAKDCSDGIADPNSPVLQDARVIRHIRVEIRLVPSALAAR